MKVIFDHNVPRRLRHSLIGHDVKTAREMSWDKLENGILLATAELAGFEAMITCDKNLSYQQNLRDRKLALIVLSTNSWRILSRNPQQVLHAIDSCLPGSFVYLTMRPQ